MRARLATALIVLSLAATACSEQEPDAGPTLPPLTGAPSPTAEPDAVPPEATAATPEGAAEFGRFFYEAVEAAFMQRDSSTLSTISSERCEICQRYIRSIDGLAERDERVEGNDITVRDAAAPASVGDEAVVTVLYDNTSARRLDAAGNLVREEPARVGVVSNLVLKRVGATWQVEQVNAE